MTRRPDLFIIGAPKAGTTSLHHYLDKHPQIFMSAIKEPDYFAPDVVGTRRTRRFRYQKDDDAYLSLFAGASDRQRIGESSTTYLMSLQAPSLIRRFSPASRAIAIVRNPIDLVYSLYYERFDNGIEIAPDFEAALALDDQRARNEGPPPHGYGAAYRDNARQGAQLERWLKEFGSDRVKVLVFDDFATDTPRFYAEVLRFLGVDDTFRPRRFSVQNASHQVRGGPIGFVMRQDALKRATISLISATLPPRRRAHTLRRLRQSRIVQIRTVRPPMSSVLRQQLAEEFAPDVERLGKLIGRDLGALWPDFVDR